MKKILFTIVLLLTGMMVQAREYVPIVREGVQWVYTLTYCPAPADKYPFRAETSMVIEFKGDTIINGESYKKCYRTFGECATHEDGVYNTPPTEFTNEPQLIACCRDYQNPSITHPDKNWYFCVIYEDSYKKEMVGYDNVSMLGNGYRYDFDACPDEHVVFAVKSHTQQPIIDDEWMARELRLKKDEFEYDYNFTEISSIEINGTMRTMEKGKECPNILFTGMYSYWIEGIGFFSYNTPGAYQGHLDGGNIISPKAAFRWGLQVKTRLSHVIENGQVVYKAPDFNENLLPETGINDVTVTPQEVVDEHYYNLQGQRVDNPTPGIYIHGGKKVVVK